MPRSHITEAVVLKRVNVGEQDRIVTLFTQSQGKIAVIAKGVRRLQSTQSAALEPGNHVKVFLIATNALPILTQTQLIVSPVSTSLKQTKQLFEVLEMIERLMPDEETDERAFFIVLHILKLLRQSTRDVKAIQADLDLLLQHLGYPSWETTTYATLSEYVQTLADRPLKSYDYLTIRSSGREHHVEENRD